MQHGQPIIKSYYHVVTIRLPVAQFVHVVDRRRMIAIFEVLVEDPGLPAYHAKPVSRLTNSYDLTYHARTQNLVACVQRLP